MQLVKEIYADGRLNETLRGQDPSGDVIWRTSRDKADFILVFNQPVRVSSVLIQFWVTSYSDVVRLHCESAAGTGEEWKCIDSLKLPSSDTTLNRVAEFVGAYPVTTRIRIEMEGGHADPFCRHYRIGLKKLELSVSPAVALVDNEPQRQAVNTDHQLVLQNMNTKRERKRRAPLYAFPDPVVVLSAIDQTDYSPWKLLTLTSSHKEKLQQRSTKELDFGFHILPRFTTPSKWTVPSNEDINLMKRM